MLFGLTNAPATFQRLMYHVLRAFLNIFLEVNVDDPCVYRKVSGSIVVFLVLYVDDILLIGNNVPLL